MPVWLMLIMKIGPLPNACRTPAERLPNACRTLPDASRTLPDAFRAYWNPEFTTHWIRGFMAFQLARYTRTVLLTVPE